MTPEQLKKLFDELRNRHASVGYEARAITSGDQNSPLSEFLLVPIGRKVFDVASGYGENFTAEHAQQMVENFGRFNSKPFFDLDHCSIWGETRAFGWVTGLEARADGVWVTGVQWTESGLALLTSGEYKYFSPAWYWNDSNPYSADGEEIGCRLISIALTNTPQYYNADNLSKRNREIRAMDFMTKLRELLGLPPEATEEQILTAVGELKTKADAAPSATDQTAANANKAIADAVRSELGLKADAPIEAVQTALASRKPKAGDKTLQEKFDELQAERAMEKAERLVDEAIAARKIVPAQRDSSIKWAAKDPEGFSEWVKDAVEVLPGKPVEGRKVGDDGKPVVTQADRDLAKRTGQKPEEIAATRFALEQAAEQ